VSQINAYFNEQSNPGFNNREFAIKNKDLIEDFGLHKELNN